MEKEKIKVLIDMLNRLIEEKESLMKTSNDEREKDNINIELDIYNTFLRTLPEDINYGDLYELKDSVFAMYSKYFQMYKNIKNKKVNESEVIIKKMDNYESNYTAYLNIYNNIDSFLKSVTLINTSYSNDIILKLMKCNNNHNDSLLHEIYDLKERRRNVSIIKYNKDILLDLTLLESLEYRISRINDNKADSYTLNKKDYRKSLLESINAINDYNFLEFKTSKYYKKNDSISEEENSKIFSNKYFNYIKKYYNLINSITNNKVIILDVDGKKISTDNLLSYLTIYNLDSNYDIFKENLNNKKINNNDFIKEEYMNQIKYINDCIKYLCNYTLDRIKNDSVLIVDSTKDKDDLVYERDEIINKINNSERDDLSASR